MSNDKTMTIGDLLDRLAKHGYGLEQARNFELGVFARDAHANFESAIVMDDWPAVRQHGANNELTRVSLEVSFRHVGFRKAKETA